MNTDISKLACILTTATVCAIVHYYMVTVPAVKRAEAHGRLKGNLEAKNEQVVRMCELLGMDIPNLEEI
jgi:hypothetical protein